MVTTSEPVAKYFRFVMKPDDMDEIQITSEMVEAGAIELAAATAVILYGKPAVDVMTAIFKAMMNNRPPDYEYDTRLRIIEDSE